MSESSNDKRKRSQIPHEDDVESAESSGTWFARLIPQRVALAALTVDVRAPERLQLSVPTSFYIVVKNRIPVPVIVSTSTSRLWGWAVDGIDEADKRVFSPPELSRQVRFGGLERKVFKATWDGRICEERNGDPVWVDVTGEHTLTGYLAVEDHEKHKLADDVKVLDVENDD